MQQIRTWIAMAVLSVIVLAGARPATAQSLEQDYAQRCADATAARDETCTVLRQALMAKLAGQQGSADGETSAHASAANELSPLPALLEPLLAGEYWHAPGSILRFSRAGTTQVAIEDVLAGQSGVLETGGDALRFEDASGTWTGLLSDDGYTLARSDGTERRTYRVRADGRGLTLVIQIEWNGQWNTLAPVDYRPLSTDEVARAARESLAAQQPEARTRHWGILADRAGRSYVFEQRWVDGQYAMSYHWERAGLVLTATQAEVAERRIVRTPRWWTRYTYDPLLQRVVGSGVAVQADGSLVYAYGDRRMVARAEADGGYTETTEHLKRGAWRKEVEMRFRPAASDLQQTLAALTAPRRASSNGGLFGALVGAAVGAYAGNAAGLDGAQTAQLVLTGAAVAAGGDGVGAAFAKGLAEETARQDDLRQVLQSGGRDAPGHAGQREQGAGPGLLVSAPNVPDVPSGPAAAARKELARYAYCIAQAGPEEGRSGKAVLYLSAVAQVGAQTPGDTERMAANFRAALPSQHPARVRAPICMTDNDPVRAQQHLDQIPDQYTGWEIVRTGIAPRP